VIYTDLADVPDKTFGVVYLDLPWRFQTYGPQDGNKGRRDAEKHYPTMSISEMKTLDVKRIAKRDSLMMMWTSWPYLEQALDLMRAYGFRYTSSFKVWVKLKRSFSHTKFFVTNPSDFAVGTGYTSRKNVELILLGRRGTPKRLAKDVRELIVSPVREHSRKPDIYADIERYAAGPYLEMFARTMRPGWSQFGNDVQKFIQPEPAVGLALPVEPEPEQMMIWDRPKPPFLLAAPGAECPTCKGGKQMNDGHGEFDCWTCGGLGRVNLTTEEYAELDAEQWDGERANDAEIPAFLKRRT
jgi:N6-adenosine-specific RNA methylase IME4